MRQAAHTMELATRGQGLTDFTGEVARWVGQTGIGTGLLTIWCRHTSCSLLVQENADPDVRSDLLDFFRRLAPEDARYRHSAEGPDDMPAHIRAAVLPTQLSVPVVNARPALGTWQGIYLVEHRTRPHRREVLLHLIGE